MGVKVGLRSHSTTSWVLPTAAAGLLKPLAKLGVKMPALDGIDGADSLSSAELQVLGKSLTAAGFKAATGKGKGKPKPGKSPPVQRRSPSQQRQRRPERRRKLDRRSVKKLARARFSGD